MGAIMKHVDKEYANQHLGMTALYKPEAILFNQTSIDNPNTPGLIKRLTAALFADDLVIFAPSAFQLQQMIDIFSSTALAFGQIVSDTKTEVMLPDYLLPQPFHPPLYLRHPEGHTTTIKITTEFKYLGSRILSNGTLGREIGIRQHAMWDAFNKYKSVTFLNPHVTLWQKLLLFNITVVPNATYGCCAWDYKPNQLQKLEGTQIKMLKLIMNQQDDPKFNMITAINTAVKHRWYHLLPIAAKIESMHIKYLRHLLVTVVPHTQLHIICRCRIMCDTSTQSQRTQLAYSNLADITQLPPISYEATIQRTRTYYNLDELLYTGLVDGKHAAECSTARLHGHQLPQTPSPPQPCPPWFITICDQYFTATNLTSLIKLQGYSTFIAIWRQHQLLTLGHNNVNNPNNITMNTFTDGDIGSDVSSISNYTESDVDSIEEIDTYSDIPNTHNYPSSPLNSTDAIRFSTTRITNSQTISHWPSEADQPDSIIAYLEREWQYLTHKHTNIIDNRYDLIPNTTAVDPPNRLVKSPSHKIRAKERQKKRRKLLHASTPNVHENTQS
jgi:hypothetical protein